MRKRMAFIWLTICAIFMISYPSNAASELKEEVYTSKYASVTESSGDGTKEHPYNRFEDAVENVAEGGTIYILSSNSALINDQGDGKPFVIDKNVVIKPEPGAECATLSSRAAGIILGADVTFQNIELSFGCKYRDHIFANGYELKLINTSRETGSRLVDLVAGGVCGEESAWTAPTPGANAKIFIQGKSSAFGNIYAGNINGLYEGDAIISLQNVNSTAVNAIYASGAWDADVNVDDWFDMTEAPYPEADATQCMVLGQVEIELDNAPIRTLCGNGAVGGTTVTYKTTDLASGQTLEGIRKLVVANGLVQPSVLTAETGENVDLEVQSEGGLDLSLLGNTITVDDFIGGGRLILGNEATMIVEGTATGTTVFETPNGVDGCSGLVSAEHTYIETSPDSVAVFTFEPDYFQRGWTLERSSDGKWSVEEGSNICIIYYADGVSGTVDVDFEVLLPGEDAEGAVALPSVGYHFVKWVDYNTGETVSDNIHFVPDLGEQPLEEYYYDAYFEPNLYCVQYHANDGEGVMAPQSFTYGVSQKLSSCLFTKEGYTFAGWNTKADGTGTSYSDLQAVSNLTPQQDGSIMLYAQWTPTNGSEDEKEEASGDATEDKKEESSGDVTEGEQIESGPSGIQDVQENPDLNHRNVTKAQVSKVTYNTITVTWDSVSGATAYHVYRSTKKHSSYKKVATVSGTSYTDKKLKTGKKYYYKIQAATGEIVSEMSDVVMGKTALEVPKVKLSVKKNTVTLRFGKVKGAQGYEIYCSVKKNKGFKKVATIKKTSYKYSKLVNKKTYYYRVRAYRKVDGKKVYSSYSKVKAVKVK